MAYPTTDLDITSSLDTDSNDFKLSTFNTAFLNIQTFVNGLKSRIDSNTNNKVDKETGKGLIENDYVNALKKTLPMCPRTFINSYGYLDFATDFINQYDGKEFQYIFYLEDTITITENTSIRNYDRIGFANSYSRPSSLSDSYFYFNNINSWNNSISMNGYWIRIDTYHFYSAESFFQKIQEEIDNKVNKVYGKDLSTNDFTNTLLNKLNNIESNAQVNTVTGVKGNNESTYRTGQINITKANIGLGNVANSTYAGGTAVTLNGTSKAASTASFYAPTSAGTSGYVLKSNGSGSPSWSRVGSSISNTYAVDDIENLRNSIIRNNLDNYYSQLYDLNYSDFTYIIDSNTKLSNWANNLSGNNYSKVLIKAGTWSYTAASKQWAINLTDTGTKVVIGEVGSILSFNLTYVVSNASNWCLNYTSLPSSDDYYMKNVTVYVTTSRIMPTAFRNCRNLYNCVAKVENGEWGNFSFSACRNLYNCETLKAGYAYDACSNVIGCIAKGGGNSFRDCSSVKNCTIVNGTSNDVSNTYSNNTTNSTYAFADTLNGGWNRFISI